MRNDLNGCLWGVLEWYVHAEGVFWLYSMANRCRGAGCVTCRGVQEGSFGPTRLGFSIGPEVFWFGL